MLAARALPGIGSREWRNSRKQNPVFEPPEPGVPGIFYDDVQAGCRETPAEQLVATCRRAIGDWIDEVGYRSEPCPFYAEIVQRLAAYPLYVEEYREALLGCLRDVQTCVEQHAVSWEPCQARDVIAYLHQIYVFISGPWLCFWLNCEGDHFVSPRMLSATQINDLCGKILPKGGVGSRYWLVFSAQLAQRTQPLLCDADAADVYCQEWNDFLGHVASDTSNFFCCIHLNILFETEGRRTSSASSYASVLGQSELSRLLAAEKLAFTLRLWRELWKLSLSGKGGLCYRRPTFQGLC